ncbi:MAG: amidohydrolase [Vicinamibacterales bacterium]
MEASVGRWRRPAVVALALALGAACRPGAAEPPAEAVYLNGRIWTGVDGGPEAQALAVREGRVQAVGDTATVRALADGATTVVDLGGRRVVPGFNDAHWHLPTRRSADLGDSGRVDEIQRRLAAFARTLDSGAWVLGRSWGPSDFPDATPHRRYLDDVLPGRLVLLTDRDGHQVLASSAALAAAGITRDTPDPANGRILRDAAGDPTGVLQEGAMGLVRRLVPAQTLADVARAVDAELATAASYGLTSVQVASGSAASGLEYEAYAAAARDGRLAVRVRAAVPFERDVTPADLAAFVALRDRHAGGLLRFGIAKGMLDGTVDARTAAMFEPYTGHDDRGLPMWTAGDLDRAVAAYDKAGLQVELHAIGDRAIRMALDAYEHAARANGTSGRRHRVEHVEVPADADLPRFAALGVIASTQAMFASPDSITLTNYAPLLGPARTARANAFRRFDAAGAVQAFGSAYPVFTMEVMRGIHTAVTRQLPEGTPAGGWHPEHRLTVEAALRHFTRDAAYAEFAEDEKGTLVAGRAADFVALSDDPFAIPPARLHAVKADLTVMGGRVTWRSPAFAGR